MSGCIMAGNGKARIRRCFSMNMHKPGMFGGNGKDQLHLFEERHIEGSYRVVDNELLLFNTIWSNHYA